MSLNEYFTKEQLENLKKHISERLECLYNEMYKNSPTKERITELELAIEVGEETAADVSFALRNKQYQSRYTVGVAPLAPDTYKVNYYRDGDCITTRTISMNELITSKNDWLAKNPKGRK